MIIELNEPMKLHEIMNLHGQEIVKECRGHNLDVYGMEYCADRYLLAYYHYDKWFVQVLPLKWHHVKEYREHYDKHLRDIEIFQDIDFTLDMLEDMDLVPNEADEMFKIYEEKFIEEEKYELLQYLNDLRQ